MDEDEGPGRLRLWREVIAQTCALVAPRQCPCGREGAWLCRHCAALLRAEPLRVDSCCDALQELTAARVREERRGEHLLPAGVDHTPLLPVLALGEYGGDLQRLILAWKNGGMLHLGARFAPALAPAVQRLIDTADAVDAADTADIADTADAVDAVPVQLVPVPSQRSARLRRGEDHTAELVRAMQRCGAGHALTLEARPTTAQDGQGARQRRTRRIVLSPRSTRRAQRVPGPVVIIDDVVTTGSTLRGMHRALTDAGMDVLGAVVIASARMPTGSDGTR